MGYHLNGHNKKKEEVPHEKEVGNYQFATGV